MGLLRHCAEQAGHRLVIKRRLGPRFGRVPMFVSGEGGLRFLRWRLEEADPWLLNMALELVTPGSVVWDIGANVGLFTFAAAALAGPSGRIPAVEPDTWPVGLLRRSSQLEPARRAPVDVLPVAIADVIGTAEFHVAQRARSASHFDGHGSSQMGGVAKFRG